MLNLPRDTSGNVYRREQEREKKTFNQSTKIIKASVLTLTWDRETMSQKEDGRIKRI